jgi:uncharacterized protein with HEPN domain
MRPDDPSLLVDMLVSARKAVERVRGRTLDEFHADEALQDTVIRQLQNVGEAASKVTLAFRDLHPEVPWSETIGMRHRLVHDYRGVNLDIVWQAATNEAPKLIALLEPLVPPDEPA